MQHVNSEIFAKIDIYGNIPEAQRVAKLRQHFNHLEKIAVKSVHSTKLAITSIIEITNRIGSLSLTSTNSILHASTTAIDKARNRHLKHSLQNASALNYLKRKSESMSEVVTKNTLSKKKQSNCTICRDVFHMPEEVYSTHRGKSSKCPNNKKNIPPKISQLDLKVKSEPRTGVDINDEESNMPSKNSKLDLKVKSEPAVDKNDEESDNNNHN